MKTTVYKHSGHICLKSGMSKSFYTVGHFNLNSGCAGSSTAGWTGDFGKLILAPGPFIF